MYQKYFDFKDESEETEKKEKREEEKKSEENESISSLADSPLPRKPSRLRTLKGIYSKYAIPPDLVLCEDHLQATSVGIEDTTMNHRCLCCGNRIHKTPLKLCESTKKLSFLGPGYPLFFFMMKSCIVLVTVFLLTFGVYALYSNYTTNYCAKDTTCYKTIINDLSFYNAGGNEEVIYIQQNLCLAVTILSVITMQYLRYKLKKIVQECDVLDLSISDFSLIVQHIPTELDINYEEELKKVFSQPIDNKEIVVENINLTYDLSGLSKYQSQIDEVVRKKTKGYEIYYKTGKFPDSFEAKKVEQEITEKENELKQYLASFTKENRKLFSGVALISFKTEEMKRMLLKKYQISNFQKLLLSCRRYEKDEGLVFQGQRVFIEEAPEPGDIYWDHLGIKFCEKILRRLTGIVLFFLILIICAAIIYIITAWEDEINNLGLGESLEIKLLTVGLSVAIVIINKFLSFVMPFIAKVEKNQTIAEDYGNTIRKLSFALFLNSAFISFSVTTFYLDKYYSQSGGLISSGTTLLVTNFCLYTGMNFINLGYQWKKYQRRKISQMDKNKIPLTQEQANKIWENPAFAIETISANMMNMLLITCFLGSLIPIGLVISLIFYISNYWIYKNGVIKESAIKNELGQDLAINIAGIMDICLLLFAIGAYLFNFLIATDQENSSKLIISILISILNWVLPTGKINEWLFPVKDVDETTNFKDAEGQFDNDYATKNPITQYQANKEKILNSLTYISSQKEM